jgi:calcyclin binding protein
MVEISEVIESPSAEENNAVDLRSHERLADADEIESALLSHLTRPSAQLHVKNLITKLRKEGKALQRVAVSTSVAAASAAAGGGSLSSESAKPAVEPVKTAEAAPTQQTTRSTTTTTPNVNKKYQSFPTHYFDCGEYNSPTVTVYIPLNGIGSHDKSKISCEFTSTSFDLIVADFTPPAGAASGGQKSMSYRLLNDNLAHEIDVSKSKYIIKSNKIIIKLGKIKGEYSYDHWTDLSAKKKKSSSSGGKGKKEDPAAGIMDLMKDMYDNGDDNMRKMIGETMYKQRTGQLNGKDGMGGMGDMGMDGLGGMGDLGL